MAASLMSEPAWRKARAKSKRTQPRPRFTGSCAGRPSFTGPGKPMATASYFQSATAFLTEAAMRAAVRVGPEGTLRGAFWPLTRTLTLLPPTSTTRIFTWPSGERRNRSPIGARLQGDSGGQATPVPPRPQ